MEGINNWKRNTAKFLTAQTISLFGSALVQYAIIWYITLQTSSGVMMTISTLCGFVPQIAISLFAGVWLDRYDRRKLIMLSDAGIAAVTLFAALLFLSGYRKVWLLFFVLSVRSAGSGIQMPAVSAYLPELVPTEHLLRVNGINSTLTSLTTFLAPAASGMILSFMTIEATFFVDAATAAVGIGITATIKATPSKKQERAVEGAVSVLKDIKKGFSYLRENAFVKQQIIFLAVVAVLISPSAFLTPLLVSRSFGAEVWRLSVSEMVFSLGAVFGGLLISVWGGFRNKRLTVIAATVFYGMMMFGIGAAPVFAVYLLFNCLIGISLPCFNAPATAALQEYSDAGMHGRVFSMVQIANACAMPLGTLLFGPMADYVSIQSILLVNSLLVVLYALCTLKNRGFMGSL